MIRVTHRAFIAVSAPVALVALVTAADVRVDLSREQVGRPPAQFEPMVGTWIIAQDGPDKVVMVDGRPWVASKDNPTKLLIESARRLYGTSNEELMDNAKQFAYFPVAVLKTVDNFSNGSISLKFKTIAGEADRASGILFNVKPNGDWLAVRYNDTENNVALWEFHNGIRRNVRFSDRANKFMLDRAQWHELKLTVDGAKLTTTLDGQVAHVPRHPVGAPLALPVGQVLPVGRRREAGERHGAVGRQHSHAVRGRPRG